MKQARLDKLKEALLTEKEELLLKVKTPADAVDDQGDDTDAIQAKILLGLNKQLDLRVQERLSQIEDALKKIENKTYGICEDCGDDISEKRLEVSPYFLTCISCAEDREKDAAGVRRT